MSFGKQYDKNGDFIREYVPALRRFPAKYIFEPHTAPLSLQRAAGCVIGVDYPFPIVDHSVAMKANMAQMKLAYARAREEGGGDGGGTVSASAASTADASASGDHPGAAGGSPSPRASASSSARASVARTSPGSRKRASSARAAVAACEADVVIVEDGSAGKEARVKSSGHRGIDAYFSRSGKKPKG